MLWRAAGAAAVQVLHSAHTDTFAHQLFQRALHIKQLLSVLYLLFPVIGTFG